jgi:hypothetical protein
MCQATDVVAHILSGKCGKINTSAAIVIIFICFVIHHLFFLVPSSHFDMYCSYIGELHGEIKKGNFWCQ